MCILRPLRAYNSIHRIGDANVTGLTVQQGNDCSK